MARDSRERDERSTNDGGLSRRGFLTRVGTGAVTVAVAGKATAEPAPKADLLTAAERSKVTLRINHRSHEVLVEPRWSLSYVLRDQLGLTGTKVGCERGECGACTVLIDGVPRYACMTLAVEAEGTEIVTIEGLMDGETLGTTQQAFLEKDAYQCGYCTSGQIMAAEGLLNANPDLSIEEVRTGMSGNLCRCGAYAHIFMAVQRAADLKRSDGGES